MGDIIQQTVGGLSIAILLTLAVLVYGHSYASTDEKESKTPFGSDTKLFWSIFVWLTVAVLLVVLVVGFLVQPASSTPQIRVLVSDASSLPSAMSTGTALSDLSSFSSFSSTLGSSLDSFSSSDISTSLGALSTSLSSASQSI